MAENRLAARDAHEDAYVWITPARQGGEACVGGTRIPTSIIASLVEGDDGESIDQVCRGYDLTRPQVITALWWEHKDGHWSWDKRTRRGKWMTKAYSFLARLGKTDDPGEFA